MKTIRILGALVCCAPLLSPRADTIIGAGETLAVTNSEALGIVPLQLHDSARLVVPGGVAAPAGLNEYIRSNPGSDRIRLHRALVRPRGGRLQFLRTYR
jgi:hypothetical protein